MKWGLGASGKMGSLEAKKRAIRRHHYSRLKKKRQHYWGRELSDNDAGFVANTPASCSCSMCRNPRKTFGEISVQEKRQLAKEKYDHRK